MRPWVLFVIGIGSTASMLLGLSPRERPISVSPGGTEELTSVLTGNPAFSWGETAGAVGYELVVYVLPGAAGEPLHQALPSLSVLLPGRASSWTPPVEQSLPAGEYAWFVRPLYLVKQEEVAAEWSAARLFRVAPTPSVQEVAQALSVLERFIETSSEGLDAGLVEALKPSEARLATRTRDRAQHPTSVTSASLATANRSGLVTQTGGGADISFAVHGRSSSTGDGSVGVVGESTATSGKVAGVWGQTASPEGAAGVFDNTAEGDILRGLSSGTLVFSVDGAGVVTGDGSGLTRLDPAVLTAGTGTVAVINGGTGATTASAARANLEAAAASHTHSESEITDLAHTADTNCHGASCDGTRFSNVTAAAVGWSAVTDRPPGLDDGDDDTTYAAGPGLRLQGRVFSLGKSDTSPMDNRISTLDSTGNVFESSMTLGADGLGLISYYDSTSQALKVVHCSDRACTTAGMPITLESGARHPSTTIGVDGLALISYHDTDSEDLKIAHCDDVECTRASISTIDRSGDVGQYTSVAIGTDRLGLISYHDNDNGSLKVAHCNDVACSTASTRTLDNIGRAGQYTSIAIGADGLGLISYHATVGLPEFTRVLRVAHCGDVACTVASTLDLELIGAGDEYTSATIGVDGLGLISYFSSGDLKVAHCNDVACTTASTYTLGSAGALGLSTSVTVGADGLGLIGYSTSDQLKVAHCSNVACSTASTSTLDAVGELGALASITIGADGLGLISYRSNGDLKVAHCANRICVPYFRRR